MTEFFDEERYYNLMNEGVDFQAANQHAAAFSARREAYDIAPPDSTQKGSAARDMSASLFYLDDPEGAEKRAMEAFTVHDGIVRQTLRSSTGNASPVAQGDYRQGLRERSVSAMYVGIGGLRRAVEQIKEGSKDEPAQELALDYMRRTWKDIRLARKLADRWIDRRFDQYETNAAWRVSVTESLFGKRSQGLRIGMRALVLANTSESVSLSTSTKGKAYGEVLDIRKRSNKGALGALFINALSFAGKPGRRAAAVFVKGALQPAE